MNRSRRRTTGPDTAFPCEACGRAIPGTAPGTKHRNHCPYCLTSLHVDIRTGDRRSGCRSPMPPIAVAVREDGEWAIVHRCEQCGRVNVNRVAGDDDPERLHAIAWRPFAMGHSGGP